MKIYYNEENITNILKNNNCDVNYVITNYDRETLREMYGTYLLEKCPKYLTKIQIVERLIKKYNQLLKQKDIDNQDIIDITK